ncbi:MAG: alkaline phosphatase D family protein [Planctomycetota bacterium]
MMMRPALLATAVLLTSIPPALSQPVAPGRAWDDTAVPTERAVAFALYTAHRGVLKLTAQFYPLADDISRDVELHVRPKSGGDWERVASTTIDETSYGWPQADRKRWLAHFRVNEWDHSRDWAYKVVAADGAATYEGLVRRDPIDQREIVVASLSCNSNQDRGPRDDIIRNLQAQDPDLLFFAGDQSYDHKKHYEAWLLFGRQFGEIMRDRPTVTIPDDHDIGQGNLWGEGGVKANSNNGDGGGYFFSPAYIRAVEAAQTWHLPDPYDPTPVAQNIGVYYTSLNVGGVDFAILEDRKFKSGPNGLVRGVGPRPDHVNDEAFDPARLDVPEAKLLGARQLEFIEQWGRDWTHAEFKAVLSQTVFANAAHLHGPGLWGGRTKTVDLRKERGNRLKADLDSNGWPQSGRDRALIAIRKAFATHLCGDQHLATLVHHGVTDWNDAGIGFASPAIVNYYVRRWAPKEQAVDPIAGELDNLGSYRDGLGNLLTMLAYVNPDPDRVFKADWGPRAEGYGLVRFDKQSREITYEVWPRMVDVTTGSAKPYAGWPVTKTQMDQYARRPVGYLPMLNVSGLDKPVFEVIDESTGETVYTLRTPNASFQPHIFHRTATYTVRISGQPGPERVLTGLKPQREPGDRVINIDL